MAIASTSVPAATAQIDAALGELQRGRAWLAQAGARELRELALACAGGVVAVAREWVDASAAAKGLEPASPFRAEEVTAGPLATLRYLRLLSRTLGDVAAGGRPRLYGPLGQSTDGRLQIPLLPAPGLFDRIAFAGFTSYVRMQEGVTPENLHDHWAIPQPAAAAAGNNGRIALVLGAGNVSSIPATDAIGKILQERRAVLLKLNPVNDYLAPILAVALAPLVDAGLLRIVKGDAAVGRAAIEHPLVDEVHITGSDRSFHAIVWGPPGPERERRMAAGQPLLTKPITAELGNVSPWIVVPGKYSARQLAFQAESLAASIVNNASFNCVATKVILTSREWPQRAEFLAALQSVLDRVPPRPAYYPGAGERFARFANRPAPAAGDAPRLPWTVLADVDPDQTPLLVEEESFVCVTAEIALDGAGAEDFLRRAVEFANGRLWGTLSAALSVPQDFRASPAGRAALDRAIADLRYAAVGINHWPALSYALMEAPWGGYPGGTLADPQSGIGWVHNPLLLGGVEKSVLTGPLVVWPKPIWLPSHKAPEPVAWALFDLYRRPSLWRLPRLMLRALRG